MPVSSFAPELLELFKRAAREEIIIPLEDEKAAIRLRARLHALRVAMRREDHSLTTIANSVQFTLSPGGNLCCTPVDNNFLEYIKAAGITIPELTTILTPDPLSKVERSEGTEAIKKFLAKD